MRNTILLALLFIGFVTASGQGFVTYSGSGSITLKDNTVLKGEVSYSLTAPGFVRLVKEGKDEKYKPQDVIKFEVDNKVYYPILAKDALSLSGNYYDFAYILNPESSKIKVYKNETQPSVVVGNVVETTVTYYVLLPGSESVYPVNDMKFTPSKKIAKYVSDCPELATKIEAKDKSVSFGLIANDAMRVNAFITIAAEYEKCNK